MFTKEFVGRIIQWSIHFVIATAFIKYIHYKYGFEHTMMFSAAIIQADLMLLRPFESKKNN